MPNPNCNRCQGTGMRDEFDHRTSRWYKVPCGC